VALKALRAPESSETARKVRPLRTIAVLFAHVSFRGYQRLENELPRWAELHHQNILPFYGVYFPDPSPGRFPWLYRDSYESRTAPLHGGRVVTPGKKRGANSSSLGVTLAGKWKHTWLHQKDPWGE